MSFLANASIRTKILAVLLPICLAGLSAVTYLSLKYADSDKEYGDFINIDNVATVELARAARNITAIGLTAYQITVYDTDDEAFQGIVEEYQRNATTVLSRLESVKGKLPADAAAIDEFISDAKQITNLTNRAVEYGKQNRGDEAKAQLVKADPLIVPAVKDMTTFNENRSKRIEERSRQLSEQTRSTIFTSLMVIGTMFLVGIIAALVVVSKGVTTPIARLRERMASLAAGDTSSAIDGMGRGDEVGQMAKAVQVFRENAVERIRLEQETEANRSLSEQQRIAQEKQNATEAAEVQFAVDSLAAGLSKLSDGDVSYRIQQPFVANLDTVRNDFNQSAEKLQIALSSVSQNARGIDAGANEIKSAADDLAKRTEQQAAAVEETAAALEQITTTVADSTKRAQEAGHLVSRAKAGAEQSGEVVRQAVHAMEQIARSANEISNIIGVIDEIAFQTNLLALNAGVEAARAGEAGKGFAVVAQEVRELAQRSANAAKEIKALITTSNTQVQQGVQLVGDTGKALQTIVSEVQEINRHVLAIVDSAQEQSSGLQQINTAVNQMDQDTQKNAAMVEESTAASHSLAKEVSSLNQLLAQFKLSDTVHANPVRPASQSDRPAVSPVRALGRKIASAFSGNAAVDTAKGEWEEF